MKTLALEQAVGPDAEVITNEAGAHQSHTPFRFDLIPPGALFAVAEILAHGAEKYSAENWRGITDPAVHANHALAHYYSWLCGDDSEGTPLAQLARAFCRTAFALEMEVLRLRAGGPQRPKMVYLSNDLTPGAHGQHLDVIERTKRALEALNLSKPPVQAFVFDGTWSPADKKTAAARREHAAAWKKAGNKLANAWADTIFPELKKKKRPVKKAAKKVVARKRASRRK